MVYSKGDEEGAKAEIATLEAAEVAAEAAPLLAPPSSATAPVLMARPVATSSIAIASSLKSTMNINVAGSYSMASSLRGSLQPGGSFPARSSIAPAPPSAHGGAV
jgi:hypothetical protein